VDRRKKILLVAVVLAAGVALALQFRKSEVAQSGLSSATSWLTKSNTGSTNNQTQSTTSQTNPAAPQTTAFDGRIENAPGAAPADAGRNSDSAAEPTSTATTGPLVNMNAPDQTHTIVDGDTLQNLAQHYLGRTDRYMELFQYNRDVLRNPEVLPIGAELRIPTQVAVPAANGAAAASVAPMTPIAPLVPLPQAPTGTLTAPAKTTIPASAQNARSAPPNATRTYTVQAGDNLVDLARKFYSDGRRYDTLYEANRRVMHNPTDLKPGMVLVVP
jgi:nucleoid-associated protein YgaU